MPQAVRPHMCLSLGDFQVGPGISSMSEALGDLVAGRRRSARFFLNDSEAITEEIYKIPTQAEEARETPTGPRT